MKNKFLITLVAAMSIGTAVSPVANASHKNKSVAVKNKMSGVNSKNYYTSFKYFGLADKLKSEHRTEKEIQSTLKIMGNWHWFKIINQKGLTAYRTTNFTKSNEVKKGNNYTPSQTIVQLQHDSAGNAIGYQYKSLVPVTSIVKSHHKTVLKTFDGVYISANRKDVKEINYYNQKLK